MIDEINRGDISKIFGELIFALEYRKYPVSTPYEVDGDTTLALPENLLIIGTMNTADRSIALVDYALRRRFVFLDVRPDRSVIEESSGFRKRRPRGCACTFRSDCPACSLARRICAIYRSGTPTSCPMARSIPKPVVSCRFVADSHMRSIHSCSSTRLRVVLKVASSTSSFSLSAGAQMTDLHNTIWLNILRAHPPVR